MTVKARRRHWRCHYKNESSARPIGSSRTMLMSVHEAYRANVTAGRGLQSHMVASVPLVPTFVRARAAKGYERRNRDTSVADLTFLPALPRVIRRNVKSKATLESNS